MFLEEQQLEMFMSAFSWMQKNVHKTAVDHGWWVAERSDAECIALMHSELSEALEAFRNGNPPDDHVPQFSNAEIEFADVIIRIMDLSEKRGFDIAGALLAKAAFNKERPFKHGGKLL